MDEWLSVSVLWPNSFIAFRSYLCVSFPLTFSFLVLLIYISFWFDVPPVPFFIIVLCLNIFSRPLPLPSLPFPSPSPLLHFPCPLFVFQTINQHESVSNSSLLTEIDSGWRERGSVGRGKGGKKREGRGTGERRGDDRGGKEKGGVQGEERRGKETEVLNGWKLGGKRGV